MFTYYIQQMQFATLGFRMKKEISKHMKMLEDLGSTPAEAREIAELSARLDLKEAFRYAKMAEEVYKEINGDTKPDNTDHQNFFITVRPNETVIKFEDFKNKVMTFLKRKMFVSYTMSLEQKGTSEDDLGKGFHCHIVAHVTCRSKGEVLRNTISTFKDCTVANCIKVIVANNPKGIIDKYLIEYASDDNHKIVTKEWDVLWREREGLLPLYVSETPAQGP